jgi:hypothetical protein
MTKITKLLMLLWVFAILVPSFLYAETPVGSTVESRVTLACRWS